MLPAADGELVPRCIALLDELHSEMLERARRVQSSFICEPKTRNELLKLCQPSTQESLPCDQKGGADENDGDDETSTAERPACVFRVPWCESSESEEQLKDATKLTVRCYPFGDQDAAVGQACIWTSEPATHMAILARAY